MTMPTLHTPRSLLLLLLVLACGSTAIAQSDQAAIDKADSYFEAKNWKAAADAYAAIYNANQENKGAAFKLAFALHSIGEYQRAIDTYMELADPGGPIVFYNLGCAYARLGMTDKAFDWLDRSIDAGFSEVSLIAEDEDLASLRGNARFAGFAQKVQSNAFPCAGDPNARAFDFWVGAWEVRDKKGNVVGHNTVDLVLGQCALIENWSGAMGGSGKSLNVFNRAKGKWQQTWINDKGDVTEYVDGETGPGTMRFTSRITKMEKEVMLRLSFYKLDENSVRQVGEYSADNGQTWNVTYDYTYVREGQQASIPLDR